MPQQVLAQKGRDVRENGHVSIIESITCQHAPNPGCECKCDDRPDSEFQRCFTRDHVEEGFDDERGSDLPAKTDEGYAQQVNEPQPRPEAHHLPDHAPGGKGWDFLSRCGCSHITPALLPILFA